MDVSPLARLDSLPPELLDKIVLHCLDHSPAYRDYAHRPGSKTVAEKPERKKRQVDVTALSETCKYIRSVCRKRLFRVIQPWSVDALASLVDTLSASGGMQNMIKDFDDRDLFIRLCDQETVSQIYIELFEMMQDLDSLSSSLHGASHLERLFLNVPELSHRLMKLRITNYDELVTDPESAGPSGPNQHVPRIIELCGQLRSLHISSDLQRGTRPPESNFEARMSAQVALARAIVGHPSLQELYLLTRMQVPASAWSDDWKSQLHTLALQYAFTPEAVMAILRAHCNSIKTLHHFVDDIPRPGIRLDPSNRLPMSELRRLHVSNVSMLAQRIIMPSLCDVQIHSTKAMEALLHELPALPTLHTVGINWDGVPNADMMELGRWHRILGRLNRALKARKITVLDRQSLNETGHLDDLDDRLFANRKYLLPPYRPRQSHHGTVPIDDERRERATVGLNGHRYVAMSASPELYRNAGTSTTASTDITTSSPGFPAGASVLSEQTHMSHQEDITADSVDAGELETYRNRPYAAQTPDYRRGQSRTATEATASLMDEGGDRWASADYESSDEDEDMADDDSLIDATEEEVEARVLRDLGWDQPKAFTWELDDSWRAEHAAMLIKRNLAHYDEQTLSKNIVQRLRAKVDELDVTDWQYPCPRGFEHITPSNTTSIESSLPVAWIDRMPDMLSTASRDSDVSLLRGFQVGSGANANDLDTSLSVLQGSRTRAMA
ncbi:uncharacterized protein L969DRAFT_95386 [Mixia osmundae IAM 14324]|uniref:Uncharacterized protein n=1 Tax=Mixia osmundae (strain CBS 9802 / IAM 14324 / JCM 22182 / KY 12970) TaxID=764103 RepID=G7DZ81_MIXOS|nr:uncharacterized protein L969DRAFT_95386 [Mixia osmundae IAM 14324]KEI38293.1 hypothetical protein L969DRAFT_95386 [Mixia osmundae IAM 14324]GAA95891.1 hypothetical protein E5Q_02549 [Mixia osmundae IAM 14324]